MISSSSSTGTRRFSIGGLSLSLPVRQAAGAPAAIAPSSPSFPDGPVSLRSPASEHLLPLDSSAFQASSPSASRPPATTSTITDEARTGGSIIVQRDELYRQLQALDNLLQLLAAYHALTGSVAKTEQKLAKACSDILPFGSTAAGGNRPTGSAEVVSNALGSTGELFQLLSAVSSKHAKALGAILGPLQEALVKHSKKVAKLARTLETSIAEREAKLRKSAGGLERSLGRTGDGAGSRAGWRGSGGGREGGVGGKEGRLLASLRELGNEIDKAKGAHLLQTSHLQTAALLQSAAALSAVGAAQFTVSTESVRRMAPAIGEVLRWKALADAGWVGTAGVGDLSLPGDLAASVRDVSIIEAKIEPPSRGPALDKAFTPDSSQNNLRPPTRPFAASTVPTSAAGSPVQSPIRSSASLPALIPAETSRQLPVAPSPSPYGHPPPSPAFERQVQVPSPIIAPVVFNGRGDASGAVKKVSYITQTGLIQDARQLGSDRSAEDNSHESREEAPGEDYRRSIDERRLIEEYEHDQDALNAAEDMRLRRKQEEEVYQRERQLKEDQEAFQRILEREAAEADAEADHRWEEARLAEEDRKRLAQSHREDFRESDRAQEREEAANAAIEEARIRSVRNRFEEFRRVRLSIDPVPFVALHQPQSLNGYFQQSDHRPSTSPPAQALSSSGGATLGRRVSQLSARFEEISQIGSAASSTKGNGSGPQPAGPRRLARTSTSPFDPVANTRPLYVRPPPANHRRTTYPFATAAHAMHSPSVSSDRSSSGSMANGGGQLLREIIVDGDLRSEPIFRGENGERGWVNLAREASVREGELRFREPAGLRPKPARNGEEDVDWR